MPLFYLNQAPSVCIQWSLDHIARGQFVEQKLMPSSSFRCDLTYKYETFDFGHTLLSYLGPT